MRKVILTAFAIIIVAAAAGGYLFTSQRSQLDTRNQERTKSQQQVADLQKQYAAVKAAGVIKTDTWKQYCDSQANLCFKYPSTWALKTNDLVVTDTLKYMNATVTNPENTVKVEYTEPLVKDGSAGNEHIVKLTDFKIGDTKLKIVGSYPVSSGLYYPQYYVLNESGAKDYAVGKVSLTSPPRFTVGKYNSIVLRGSPVAPKFTNSAQAEVWFDSIDGKTAQAILASYSTK
jgi:type II secretory pathway pseudopilin PulG